MNDYIFILGRSFKLSLLELLSYFKSRSINYNLKEYSKIAAIFSLPDLDFKALIKNLGGTIKICLIIKKFENVYLGSKNKIGYGVSYYSNIKEDIRSELKKYFKKEKLKAFYKPPKLGKILSPSEIIKSNLDLEIIFYNDRMAKTIACFNPFEIEERDLKRPKQDYLKVISIRLAKILINLSQAREKQTLLDPFCGYSTILQEALLMNINAIGADKDKISIEASKINLNWLKEKYKLNSNYKLLQIDSTTISKYIQSVDAVATEPYLGPYIKKQLDIKKAIEIKQELQLLYIKTLLELKKITKGKIVIIFPIFITKKKKVKLNIKEILSKTGLKISNDFKEIKLPIKIPEGRLHREIYILE